MFTSYLYSPTQLPIGVYIIIKKKMKSSNVYKKKLFEFLFMIKVVLQ